MATFSYTYTIANGQKADATPVQQNLNDARTFMLGTCWHTDGTNGFSQSAIVSQNTKSILRTGGVQYPINFDTVTQNSNSIWQGLGTPNGFKCLSAGYYSIDLQVYTLNTAETGQNSGYLALSNVTSGVVINTTQNAAGAALGGASFGMYLALNDSFQFLYILTVDGYLVSATASVVQVGR